MYYARTRAQVRAVRYCVNYRYRRTKISRGRVRLAGNLRVAGTVFGGLSLLRDCRGGKGGKRVKMVGESLVQIERQLSADMYPQTVCVQSENNKRDNVRDVSKLNQAIALHAEVSWKERTKFFHFRLYIFKKNEFGNRKRSLEWKKFYSPLSRFIFARRIVFRQYFGFWFFCPFNHLWSDCLHCSSFSLIHILYHITKHTHNDNIYIYIYIIFIIIFYNI